MSARKQLSLAMILLLILCMLVSQLLWLNKYKRTNRLIEKLQIDLLEQKNILATYTSENYPTLDGYNTRLLRNLIFNTEVFNAKFDTLNNKKLNHLEQLCIFKTTDSILESDQLISVAKAYNCLSQIHNQRYLRPEIESVKTSDNIYKSLRNISQALDIKYLNESADLLVKTLIIGYEDQIPEELKNKLYTNGLKNDEIIGLQKLVELGIPEISARANYRLSLIYSLGRSSAKEKNYEYDFTLSVEKLNEALRLSGIKSDRFVDVALTIDDKYANYAATTIASALVNADLGTHLRFYIVEDRINPLTEESKKRLQSLQSIRTCDINFIKLSDNIANLEGVKFLIDNLGYITKWPQVTLYRLFLDKVLPNLNKVIYLDTDLVVLKDLSYLQDMDIKDYYLATSSVNYGPNGNFNYINSGVLVLNLDKFRKENALQKLVDTYNKNKQYIIYPDQDLLNLAFKEDIYFLPYQWNVTAKNKFNEFIIHLCAGGENTKKGLKNARENRINSLPRRERLYWLYRQLTPWKGSFD